MKCEKCGKEVGEAVKPNSTDDRLVCIDCHDWEPYI
jgi:formylmethanofuran dehydrogenase subunit E